MTPSEHKKQMTDRCQNAETLQKQLGVTRCNSLSAKQCWLVVAVMAILYIFRNINLHY